MENGLVPIELREIDAGIQNKSSDLAIEGEFQRFPLKGTSKNWSFGKRRGITSRYGIMPFPGHCSKDNSGETAIDTSGKFNGIKPVSLAKAEDPMPLADIYDYDTFRNNNDVYDRRRAVLGATIIPQAVQPISNTVEYPVLYWMTNKARVTPGATKYQFDLAPSTKYGSNVAKKEEIVSQFEATVGGGTARIPSNIGSLGTGEVDATSFSMCSSRVLTEDLFGLRASDDYKWFLNFAEHNYNFGCFISDFAVMKYFADAGSVVRPNNLYFNTFGQPYFLNSPTQMAVKAAVPSGDYLTWSAPVSIKTAYEKTADLKYLRSIFRYSYSIPIASEKQFSFTGKLFADTANITWTATRTTGSSAYLFALCSTGEYTVSVGVRLNAIAYNGKAIIVSKHNQIADKTEVAAPSEFDASYAENQANDYLAWSDATKNIYQLTFKTKRRADNSVYIEDSQPKNTCWAFAEPFSTGVQTAPVTANKGILEAGKEYEYAYSIVNKITGVESNVGTPAKVYTGVATNAAILVARTTTFINVGTLASPAADVFFFPTIPEIVNAITNSTLSSEKIPLNLFSYRLYYREVGSFEWLFSGEHSFASLYFDNTSRTIYIGQSDAVGLPGGQPGAYIDNSPLPEDKYIDVVSFAGKLWWVSKDAVRFSSQNAFVYPARNYIAASSGEFRGAKVHFFPGQAEARGRLVVFGSKGYYDIRQTSEFLYTQVKVSATAQPQTVPIPDSNFIVSERSSHTAFSGRCAVVAEGHLYFWGPTGIFRDDGVNLPVRVSYAIEPNLFDSYDNTKTDEFFAYYNKKSQEILFFYRPADTSDGALTRAWVYSTRTMADLQGGYGQEGQYGAWSQYTYASLIDWAQEIDLTKFAGCRLGDTVEPPRGDGLRTMIGVRAAANSTVSRPYFHDDQCDCGDMTPGLEMMVKTVSRVDANTVRLTFASDYNATILASVSAGSKVYVFGSQEYGQLAVSLDGLREVVARGVGTLDIKDSSALAGTTSLSMRGFFPVFFSGYHDFNALLDTNFFAPYGTSRWCRFRYSHLLIQPVAKYAGTMTATSTISWNCNHTLASPTSKVISVDALNTREKTTQVIFDMASPGMQSEGQGVELQVSYNQMGPRWTLYAWTLWTAPQQGTRNILTYQQ